MRVVVVGAGYVGFSLALLTSVRNQVTVVDVSEEKIERMRRGSSPVLDESILSAATPESVGRLTATLPHGNVYRGADLVIVATPTNYDDLAHAFDTSQVTSVVTQVLQQNPGCVIVIKSTVPIGFTEELSACHPGSIILFSPEFLREGRAYSDGLRPSRIIVGIPRPLDGDSRARQAAQDVVDLFAACAEQECPSLILGATEAEAVKLFANSYLALRVAFFNELDTYAASRDLDPRHIIDGVCTDPRIGGHYNNPSFGYGGYCLPKDTKQLLANYKDVPQVLVNAIVESNRVRKDFIADEVTARVLRLVYNGVRRPVVGVFRLSMKSGSSDSRSSSVLGVMRRLQERGIAVQVYEPESSATAGLDAPVVDDLDRFIETSDLIIANRWEDAIQGLGDRVYCCDLYGKD